MIRKKAIEYARRFDFDYVVSWEVKNQKYNIFNIKKNKESVYEKFQNEKNPGERTDLNKIINE